MGSHTMPIPTIDLTLENSKPHSSSRAATCNDIRRALEEHGWFVAKYDKLSLHLRDVILSDLRELFELPYETKIQNTSDKPAFGYVGKITAIPLHEGLGIDRALDLGECQKFTNLMWPSGNDRFCENAHLYAKTVAELEQTVVRMLFESYGVEKHCESHVEATTYLLRFLNYRKPENDEANLAFVTHTDKSFISILHQNHVRGLELRNKDGEWIGFEPSPSSFVVLAGDACMAWSNNRVRPGYHRVVMKGNEARYALGFFSFRGGLIETPEELIDAEHPMQYKPFDHVGLLRFYDSVDIRERAKHTMTKAYCGV
ncbi:deoxypodophyllotoxin synthase-like [Syzygium oleosum]|uniref:deoxypodophyllotoxin synthase-like n=1 Tax=Syzygium oleosum TaxID=219896 RepID=UPI0011D1A894|nr:deoxypodophyllotoxin synthase-like [Syzygium oleosum]